MSKSKINYAGLKISFALMLALLVVPAYVVAPVLFSELDPALAGLIAGKVFHVSNLAILILAVAAVLFCKRIEAAKATWYLLIAVAVMVAVNVFGVAHMMALIKAEAGDISALTYENRLRWAFSFWHGFGSILQLISSVLMVILVMKGQCPRPKDKAVV